MAKKLLSLTTGIYLGLFFFGLATGDNVQASIAAAGICLNAIVSIVHREEFWS